MARTKQTERKKQQEAIKKGVRLPPRERAGPARRSSEGTGGGKARAGKTKSSSRVKQGKKSDPKDVPEDMPGDTNDPEEVPADTTADNAGKAAPKAGAATAATKDATKDAAMPEDTTAPDDVAKGAPKAAAAVAATAVTAVAATAATAVAATAATEGTSKDVAAPADTTIPDNAATATATAAADTSKDTIDTDTLKDAAASKDASKDDAAENTHDTAAPVGAAEDTPGNTVPPIDAASDSPRSTSPPPPSSTANGGVDESVSPVQESQDVPPRCSVPPPPPPPLPPSTASSGAREVEDSGAGGKRKKTDKGKGKEKVAIAESNTLALARKTKQSARTELDEAVDEIEKELEAKCIELAGRLKLSLDDVKARVRHASKFKKKRAYNEFNAKCWYRMNEMNEGRDVGDKYLLPEIMKIVEAEKEGTWSKEELDALKVAYNAYREEQDTGPRKSNRSAARDVTAIGSRIEEELNLLEKRTGARGFVCIASSSIHDSIQPLVLGTPGTKSFFLHVCHMDDATFGAKFDKWSTLGDGMPKDLTLRRSEVVNMLEAAYRAATGKPTAKINYKQYERVVKGEAGFQIVGWPEGFEVGPPSNFKTGGSAAIVHLWEGLKSGACRFIPVPEDERAQIQARYADFKKKRGKKSAGNGKKAAAEEEEDEAVETDEELQKGKKRKRSKKDDDSDEDDDDEEEEDEKDSDEDEGEEDVPRTSKPKTKAHSKVKAKSGKDKEVVKPTPARPLKKKQKATTEGDSRKRKAQDEGAEQPKPKKRAFSLHKSKEFVDDSDKSDGEPGDDDTADLGAANSGGSGGNATQGNWTVLKKKMLKDIAAARDAKMKMLATSGSSGAKAGPSKPSRKPKTPREIEEEEEKSWSEGSGDDD